MSQITIYLPPAIADKARREAKRSKQSLSAYFARLVHPDNKLVALDKVLGSAVQLPTVDDDDLLQLDEA
jgi:hypothetical protein